MAQKGKYSESDAWSERFLQPYNVTAYSLVLRHFTTHYSSAAILSLLSAHFVSPSVSHRFYHYRVSKPIYKLARSVNVSQRARLGG